MTDTPRPAGQPRQSLNPQPIPQAPRAVHPQGTPTPAAPRQPVQPVPDDPHALVRPIHERWGWALLSAGGLGLAVVLLTGPLVVPSKFDYQEAADFIISGGINFTPSTTPERNAIARHQAMQEVNRRQRAIEAALCGTVAIVGASLLTFNLPARRR